MAFSTEVNSAGIRKHFSEEQKFFKFYVRITKSDKQVCSSSAARCEAQGRKYLRRHYACGEYIVLL